MFDLRSKKRRFVALVAASATMVAGFTFLPISAQAAAGTVSDGLCSAAVSETAGVSVYNSGDYCYVAFKTAGTTYTWTPTGVSKIDLLVVGGGGGGGSRHAGGGGAGGLLQSTAVTINATQLSIKPGAGGAGGSGGADGSPGYNSVVSGGGITTVTANGGGRGAYNAGAIVNVSADGSSAGSAGGGNNSTAASQGGTAAAGTAGQGNAGGRGYYQSPWASGGGGGAGGAGGDASTSSTGAGGAGASVSWITTAAQTALSVGAQSSGSVYFAGGGSGGGTGGSTGMVAGSAGIGGGGQGIYNTADNASAGAANTGGGGGGSGQNVTYGAGGNGGSGVVVIRYVAPKQVLSYNFSDINSYDSSVGTAVNDLSVGGTNDGTVTAGSNSQVASFVANQGSLSFGGGANNAGPFVALPNISSTQFASSGMTFDFEADFGAVADSWESVISLSASGGAGDLLYIGRNGTSNNILLEVYNGIYSQGFCQYAGIPTSGHATSRWTFSIDGNTCRIWKDGTSVATSALAGKPLSGVTWASNFMAKSNTVVSSFEGTVRSMRIYSGAVTPTQIGALTNKTVTYNSNGSGASNTTAVTSATLRLPAAPNRTNYTFDKWNTQADGLGTSYPAASTFAPTADTTLYAKWIANTYTVTYDYNGATNNNLTLGGSFTTGGNAINLPSPIKTGYKFAGWYSDAGFTTSVGTGTYSPTGSTTAITLYAKWSLVDLVISYNASDINSFDDSAGSAVNDLSTGGTYDATFSNKLSSTFAADTGSWTFGGGTNGAGQSITLPSLSSNGFATPGMTLDFEADFGTTAESYERIIDLSVSGSNNSNVVVYREGTSSNLAFMVYNGATQLGICVAAGAIPAGGGMNRFTIAIDGTTCRIWKNGVSQTPTITSAGNTMKPPSGKLWATNYIGRSNWSDNDFKGSLRSMRILAGAYSPDEVGAFNYKTISYDTNAGSSVIASTRYTSGSVKLPAGPTRSGYTFTGWYDSSAASTLVGAAGATYTPSANKTLYAGWAASTRTITFKANDGLSTADITQDVTDSVATALRSNTFTKNNSTFVGWNTLANRLGTPYTNSQSVTLTGNLTLYASWEDNATITFDSNGGSSVATVSHVPYAAIPNTYVSLAKPSNPTKSGKLFGGWSTSETLNNGNIANLATWPRMYESSAQSDTLYAIWLDECSFTRTTFTGTGKTNVASATYGETGKSYVRYRLNTVGSCGWTVPAEVTKVDALTVGGGGAGSYGYRAGGGGAGSLMVSNSGGHSVDAGEVVPILVGAGGSFNTSTNVGAAGSPTVFGPVFAAGGGQGAGGNETTNGQAGTGGSGGGGANDCRMSATGGSASLRTVTGWTGYANVGGNGRGQSPNCSNADGAGGGGAGGAGGNNGTGGASLTRFGIELAGGGAAWGSSTLNGGGTVGGDWTNSTVVSNNSGVANTGSGGAGYGDGAGGTVIIQFVLPTYTATYNYNSATGGATPTSADFTFGGSALTLPTPTRTGYAFDGWYSDAGITSLVGSAGASYSPSADITLYAKWSSAPNQTVVFDANGGSGSMTSQVANLSTNLTASTFTRSGYTFAGWATAANGTGTQYADAASYPFTAGTTLYAQWTAIPNKTVTFDANDGSGSPATSTQAANVATNLTSNTFTRTGYNFAGWNTAANGSGTAYSDGASFAFAAGTTLYAQWTAINYTVTYNSPSSTSGAVPTDSANYRIGNSMAILGNSGSLARTGYTFAGWTIASNGSGTVLVSGNTYTVGSSNINLYAKWTANTYTISYNANGASGAQANTTDRFTTGGTAVTLSAVGTMVKAGHTFNGWATSASGTPIAGTYTTTSNVTLYAQWSINTITVTYDKGTASSATFTFPSAPDSANYGTRLNLSNSVASSVIINGTYYAFVGWSDGTTTYATGTSYLLQSNVTMTAIWVQAYEVRYSFNGGTAANGSSEIDAECTVVNGSSLLCTNGQQITLNAAPTRAGYDFAGWRDQSGTDLSAATAHTLALTSYLFYAQWTPISYTVTYSAAGGASTPTESSKNIGDRFTTANAITRTGYAFAGWSDGSNTYGAGATYVVAIANITLTAQWTPNVYTVNYDWNGGSGTAIADANYTVGTTGITLPSATDQVKDGYTFGGWASSVGGLALSTPFVPTASTTLYAIWGSGSYNITYAPELGTVGTTSLTVANGNTVTLETPTRQGFIFDGWYTAQTGGSRVGGAGANFTPSSSRTLHARWTQASLYGVSPGQLSRLGSINASNSAASTYSGSNGNSSVSVNVPSGALPAGTAVNIDMIGDTTHANSLINVDRAFILSIAVSWLASDGTVPSTNAGKSISVTLTNSSIKAGALIFSVQGTSVTLLGVATQNGTVTFELTQDPGIYIVATSPTAPQSPTASVTSSSATITWQAPSSDGGDAITGYTVTLNNSATCTTTGALSCSINGLTAGTTYTYTVTATNSVGTSPSASGSFSIAGNQTVVFDSNGGTGTMSSQAANTSTALTANTFSRTGYSFTGWNTAANGSGTAYADGATYAFSTGTTLYAQWSGSTYTVTYNYNSATIQNGPSSSGFTSGGTAISLPSPTKTGYTFDGWYTDSGFATLLGAGGYSYSPTSSVTLYAKFTALPNQTVIFDANGGSGTMSNQVTNVATALTANTFTQTGYTFAGWNTAANGSGTAYADGANFAFTAGATLYAQWTLIPVTPPAPTPVTPPAPQVERPDAPTNVTATANGDSITVSWSAPTFTGGQAIVNYRVTSSSGMACITTENFCTFNGVNKDVSYSFTVTANNGTRVSNPSAASNSILIPSQLINQRALNASGSQSARGAAIKVVVSGGSTGGPVIYDVTNGTATGCSIGGDGWLTATTTGTCLVTVTMLGDFIYKPVSSAPTSILFLCKLASQAPLSITSSGSTSVALGATGGSGLGAVSFAITGGTADCVLIGNTITVAKTGTCVVVATKAADNVYEATTSAPATITVTQAKPVIVTPPPVVKVSPVKHVVAVAPSGKPILVGVALIKPVIFGPDSAKLDAGDMKQLRAAAALAKSKNMDVLVTGFVKSAGKTSLIEKLLASSRAKAVATYLRKLGVNVSIAYAGYGAYNKVAPSSNDRRVEIRWLATD